MKIHEQITEATWCKKVIAMDMDGKQISTSKDPRACKWCLLGWLCKTSTESEIDNRWNTICKKLGVDEVSVWNDDPSRTFQEVLQLCKELDI